MKARREALLGTDPNGEPAAERVAERAPDPQLLRWPIITLLLSGLALITLGQAVYDSTRPDVPPPVYLIFALGLSAFLLAGHGAVEQDARLWDNRPLRAVASFLRLHPAQLFLLLAGPLLAYLARQAAGNGLQALAPVAAGAGWLLAIAAVLLGSMKWEWSAYPRPGRRELLLTLALFLVAFLLRGLFLDQIPTTLSGDEASAGLVAVQFRNGEANNVLGLGWFSFPAFYFAVQSAGVWLFGQTAAALRITSALAGALTVFALYWLGRTLFGRLVALLAALYLMASHFHIHFSRIGLQNIWDGLFLTVIWLGIWHGWQSGRRNSFVLAGLFLGLAPYFYVSSRVLPLLLLVWAGVALLADRARFRERFPDLLLAAFVVLVIALPLGLLFLEHPAEFGAPMNRVSIFNGWLDQEVMRTGRSASAIIIDQMRLTALGFAHEPLRHWYNPGAALLLPAAGGLFVAGIVWLGYTFDLRSLLLFLPLVAQVVMGGLSQDPPASQRFVLVMPVVALILALPLAKLVEWVEPYWPRQRRLLAALALLLMGLIVVGDLNYYFRDVYDHYVLGGVNTETAHVLAHYLQEQEDPSRDVYFFGWPRMGYYSISTVPYLAPEMEGHDINQPLNEPPDWNLPGPSIFVFLPERQNELQYIQASFPQGEYREFGSPSDANAPPLFYVYEVDGP